MKQTMYITTFRDTQHGVTRYFGPFATMQLAFNFRDKLIPTKPGGRKDCVALQPFTSFETEMVNERIRQERQSHAA